MAASDNPKHEESVKPVSEPQRELHLQVPRARDKHPELHDADGNQR